MQTRHTLHTPFLVKELLALLEVLEALCVSAGLFCRCVSVQSPLQRKSKGFGFTARICKSAVREEAMTGESKSSNNFTSSVLSPSLAIYIEWLDRKLVQHQRCCSNRYLSRRYGLHDFFQDQLCVSLLLSSLCFQINS